MNVLYKVIKPYVVTAKICCCDKIRTRNLMCKNIENILVFYHKGISNFNVLLEEALRLLKMDNSIKDYVIVDDTVSIDNYTILIKFSSENFNFYKISFPKRLNNKELEEYLLKLDTLDKSYLYENSIL